MSQIPGALNSFATLASFDTPPIHTVVLLGYFWGNASAKAAQLTLWIGSLLGIVVFAINKLLPESIIGEIPLMMAFYQFIVCLLLPVTLLYVYPVKHTRESITLY